VQHAPTKPVSIRFPRTVARAFTALEVAKACNYPHGLTGKGFTCGFVELGGAVSLPDLRTYMGKLGLPVPSVQTIAVDGATVTDDGPDGASGEVNLDVQVTAAIAPGADYRVYFGPNTDRPSPSATSCRSAGAGPRTRGTRTSSTSTTTCSCGPGRTG
jgi:subtilase family serine protease